MDPIHPGLAPRSGWLRAEHRVSNRTHKPLVSLHACGIAADRLTTGIDRFYAEA